MASPIFLLMILFHLLLATELVSCVRIPLTHASRKTWPKYTSTNSVNNNPPASPGKSPMKFSNDIYTMSLAIGTPPKPFSAIMDTGSNLIWTKCKSSGSGLYDTSMSTRGGSRWGSGVHGIPLNFLGELQKRKLCCGFMYSDTPKKLLGYP
ncbi:putative nepenthesin [Helianthus annuus]|nr:putative nepenthesin [Helianthus annuus]KAJ0718459.1 putative nepenthesin [Helianthus annuus]KAJ0721704.1 putative nepenthesin [Helianthus annuus]KAJ0896946.1 putative nepenthesin [Helianthus annuus]